MLISGISFGLQQAKIKSLDGQCRYEYIRHDYGKEFFALQAIGLFFFLLLIILPLSSLAFPISSVKVSGPVIIGT